MNEILSSEIDRLGKAFDSIQRETPSLKPVVEAFRDLLISRAVIKASLPECADIHIPPPDGARLSEGYPLLPVENIESLVNCWSDHVNSMIQPLIKAFPNIRLEILKVEDALHQETIGLKNCTRALLEGREEDITGTADRLGLNPLEFKFIIGQIVKPFIEKGTEGLRPLIKDLPWHQGYCPICGASPELSFLKGDEGQRYLRCALCGYSWRFDRMTCPHCGERKDNKKFISVDGREHEWIEFCSDCNRYIVGIDMRKQIGITPDVAGIGMVHLDIIAQRKGFLPIAECAWNVVPPDN